MNPPALEDLRAADDKARGDVMQALLELLCEACGARLAMVVQLEGQGASICALHDPRKSGVAAEVLLECSKRLSVEPLGCSSEPAAGPEGYMTVPIVLANGRYFGNLCALGWEPADLPPSPRAPLCRSVAKIIAAHVDQRQAWAREQAELFDERATAELREQFIAILGHDLRNPLQALLASGDTLERKLADPVLLGITSRIKTTVRRMSALIDDVLDFARGRLGSGIELELAQVDDVNAGLMAVTQEIQDAQPDTEIVADIRVTRPVRCDLGRLQQVASNLLANALTHGAPHSTVKIKAGVEADELVLTVWNAGEPIPAESLGKIFEPFWRHSVSASRHGLGLGLHICSEIVRAHHGRMSVTSSRENGTRFTARLPLAAAVVSQVHSGHALQRTAAG